MVRVAGLILAGIGLGLGGAALFESRFGTLDGPSAATGGAARSPEPAPNAFEANLAAYERAAAAADAGDLAARIESAAAGNASWQRDTEIRALLARLVAIDPRQAVRLAERFALGNDVLAGLLQTWAAVDPDAAIAAAGNLASPSSRRAAALALLDVVGFAEADTERVAAALPEVEANNFRLDAIARYAVQDLPGALERALSLDIGQAETAAEQQIAVVMARIDPEAALSYENMIPVPVQRIRYRDRLFDEWAKTDPEAMLAYLGSTSDLSEVLVGEAGFQALATSAPEQLFVVADRFAASQRARAQAAAIDVLATLDPVAAYERVTALPATNARDAFIDTIGKRYAEQDPEAALAWASAIEPRSAPALNAVITELAAADPARAADLVVSDLLDPAGANSMDTLSVAAVLATPISEGSAAIPEIADSLAAHRDPRVRGQLDTLLMSWARGDADAAIDWVLGNTDAVRSDSAATLALSLTEQNPELARETLQRLPNNLRAPWISGVSAVLAARDAAAAQSWLLTLPSGPARDQGLGSVLQGAARAGSVNRQLLNGFSSEEVRAQALGTIMTQLGATDPELGRSLIEEFISDPQMRESAERQLEAGARRPGTPIFFGQ